MPLSTIVFARHICCIIVTLATTNSDCYAESFQCFKDLVGNLYPRFLTAINKNQKALMDRVVKVPTSKLNSTIDAKLHVSCSSQVFIWSEISSSVRGVLSLSMLSSTLTSSSSAASIL